MVQTDSMDNAKAQSVALILEGAMDVGVNSVTKAYTNKYGATRAVDAIND
jgi:hypothetical protein